MEFKSDLVFYSLNKNKPCNIIIELYVIKILLIIKDY
jgi:hypothetical protein